MKKAFFLLFLGIFLQNCQKESVAPAIPSGSQTAGKVTLFGKKWVEVSVDAATNRRKFDSGVYSATYYEFTETGHATFTTTQMLNDNGSNPSGGTCADNSISQTAPLVVEEIQGKTILKTTVGDLKTSTAWEVVSLSARQLELKAVN